MKNIWCFIGVVKGNDINKDKCIGVGGHFEATEGPEECLVREETGYKLTDYSFKGIVTFVYRNKGEEVVEYMHLFIGRNVISEPVKCDEGVLEWIPKDKLLELELWEGDKIFIRLLWERERFFSLKLLYDSNDNLISAVLDGKKLEKYQ